MYRRLLPLALSFALTLVTASVYAGTCDPKKDPKCPPPSTEEGCTPGFWKNHTESWVGGEVLRR